MTYGSTPCRTDRTMFIVGIVNNFVIRNRADLSGVFGGCRVGEFLPQLTRDELDDDHNDHKRGQRPQDRRHANFDAGVASPEKYSVQNVYSFRTGRKHMGRPYFGALLPTIITKKAAML